MKAVISDAAKASLRKITKYYKEKGYDDYADRIVDGVFTSMKELERQPNMGSLENQLSSFEKEYSFVLVEKHFKVIHHIDGDTIYVSAVFDTRQDPDKMETEVLKSK